MAGSCPDGHCARAIAEFRERQAALLADVVEAKRDDPAVRQWSMDSKKAVEDGSIWEQIESQPEPHEIVEQWRNEHPTCEQCEHGDHDKCARRYRPETFEPGSAEALAEMKLLTAIFGPPVKGCCCVADRP